MPLRSSAQVTANRERYSPAAKRVVLDSLQRVCGLPSEGIVRVAGIELTTRNHMNDTARTRRSSAATAGSSRKRAATSEWDLRLYIAGETPRAIKAFENLKRICEEHLAGRYHIEIVDLVKNPALAKGDQIAAVPALVRRLPEPLRKIIGDLSNTERVLVGLDIRAHADA